MATERITDFPELPPYRQMIMEALDSLKQKEGANKSTISERIESKYKRLPAAHANLLKAYLILMRDGGELLFINNNYLRPGIDSQPKRGRGRPREESKDPKSLPKPKKPKPAAVPPAVSKTRSRRPRGRPRKVKPQAAPNGLEG